MPRTKSSQRWLKEHFNDPYVKRAQQLGYRSRAAFKLLEIQQRDRVIKSGMTLIDLGAAPGGWTQLLAQWVGPAGKVFAVDLLPMPPIVGVEILQGDIQTPEILAQLRAALASRPVDVIVSDMAPNASGHKAVDQPRMIALAELCLWLAKEVLKPRGTLLLKIFQGSDYEAFVRALRQSFQRVVVRKPDASRARSAEVYLLATGFMV